MNRYTKKKCLEYLINASAKLKANSDGAQAITEYVDKENLIKGLQLDRANRRRLRELDDISIRFWSDFRQGLREALNKVRNAKLDRFGANIRDLAAALDFSQTETAVFELLCLDSAGEVELLILDVVSHRMDRVECIRRTALLTGLRVPAVEQALSSRGRLMGNGLVVGGSHRYDREYRVPAIILSALQPPHKGLGDFIRCIIGEPLTSTLRLEDYPHLQRECNCILKVLQGALRKKEKGVNILLHGPPGTGKTELSRVLAGALRKPLYGVGLKQQRRADHYKDSDDFDELDRVSQLRLAFQFAPPGTVVLFDEMDDLLDRKSAWAFFGVGAFTDGKALGNRLLEDNPVPVLWTANDTDLFDDAFLRRMTLVVEVPTPPAIVREHMLRRVLDAHALKVAENEIRTMARQYALPPSFLDNAARVASLSGDASADSMRLALDLSLKAMGRHGKESALADLPAFRLDLSNADQDLAAMTSRIATVGNKRVSLLLYGPPGTGKSAYVRHLAEMMGLEVVMKRASDLLNMYVGGTEQRIAEAFEQAEQQGAFLVFDEADSLLGAREGAQRSWEVSQVNEMLTWMERHPLPFACTTNLLETVDSAAMRRFLFKIKLDFMTRQQCAAAFKEFFQLDPPKALSQLERITPGDFAVVLRKARILGVLDDAPELVRMLEAECSVKRSRRVGMV